MKVIAGHTNMDFDCLASMAAARLIYDDHTVVFPDNAERMVMEYIKREDIGIPHIFAAELSEEVTEAVLVDNDDLSRAGLPPQFTGKTRVTAVYDHHPAKGGADTEMFTRNTGANITILVSELEKRGIPYDSRHVKLFLLGLYEDTGMFTYVSLTLEDVRVFNILMERFEKNDISYVARYLVTDFKADQLSLLDDLVKKNYLMEDGNKRIALCHAESDTYISNVSFVVQRLMFILSVDAVFVVVRLGKNVYFFARSRTKKIDVLEVVSQFGGGGHPSAAYAALKEISFVEVREKVMNLLEGLYENRIRVSDIMNSKVIYALPGDTVDDVRQKMTAHNHSKLPVLDGDRRPLGIITRKETDRLFHHALGNHPVSGYMNEEIYTVEEADSLYGPRKALMEERQSMVVVKRNGMCVGVITKNDLLKTEFLRPGLMMVKKNLMSEMKYSLKGVNFQRIRDIGNMADGMGYRSYVVGGLVRDLILKKQTFDIDVVIEGSGLEVAREMAARYGLRLRSHRKFQTASLEYEDGIKIDIAPARSETYEKPGALPMVMRSPLRYDLYRRDFTVNAMAVSISESDFGDLYDFFGGYDDIRKKTLKVLHTISFIEDPSRILRGVRFAARFGFDFGRQTGELLKNALELGVIRLISGRRVKDELFLIFKEDYPENVMEIMTANGIFSELFPQTAFGEEKAALFREVRHVFHWYKLLYLRNKADDKVLYLLALFGDMEPADLYAYAAKFELTRKFMTVFDDVHEFIQSRYKNVHKKAFLKNSEINDMFRDLQIEGLLYVMARYADNQRLQQYASLYIMEIKKRVKILNGNDLKNAGFNDRMRMKEILKKVNDLYLDEKIKTKKEALEYLEKYFPPR